MKLIRLIIFFSLLCCLTCFSQETSPEFSEIKSNSLLTPNEKDLKFQNLLAKHKASNHINFLIGDAFEITRWQWQQGWDWADKAIQLSKRNLDVMDSLKIDDESFYKRNLFGLGYYQFHTNNSDDALLTFKKLLTFEKRDLYVLLGAYNIAEIYYENEQYFLSKDYYYLSKSIAQNENNYEYILKNAIGIAQACKLINSPKSLLEGTDLLTNSIIYAESINDKCSNIMIKDELFYNMYNLLGNLYIDRSDYDFKNGKINLEKALEIAIELNNSNYLNRIYNDLGVLYLKDNRKEAEYYLKKALNYDSNQSMVSRINRNLSIHYLFFKNYDQAIHHIQKSLATLVDLNTSDITSLPAKLDLNKSDAKFQLISALIDKAYIWIALGEKNLNNKEHLINALDTLELADYLAEVTRIENVDQRSKLFWNKTATEIYLNATKVCFLLNKPEKAFYFIEKNKALLLLEDVSLKNIRSKSEIPKSLATKELTLKSKITELESLSLNKINDSIQRELLIARETYNEYINSLNNNYKFYYKTLQPVSIIDIQTFRKEFVKSDNAYVEYILDDKDGYGIAITDSKIKLFELNKCDELLENTVQYRHLIEVPFKDKTTIELYQLVSNKIYESLFPKDIQTLIRGKKLTILPDYYLQNIPFESLSTSKNHQSYLIEKNEISYAYSLTFLYENRKGKKVNLNNIIAFAPVHFSSDLSSLPNTEDELSFIDKTFSSKLYLRENATKEKFIKESNNHKVIHIASHANANDSINPWISFYSSKINLNELYEFKNSAELVILSACNTSLGALQKGEGVMSLSRAFFHSGSQSVLPTLWEVNDKSSLELLESFYINLKQGQNKSLALHNAKLNYIKSNSLSQASPYYWASFILIGDTEIIELENNFSVTYYLIIGFILLIIIIFFFFRKKKFNS